MRLKRMPGILTTMLAALFAGSAGFPVLRATPEPKKELTVSAAISLKDALDEAKQLYTSENPSVSIAANYGASGTLQLQIEQGAPVDIFFSAAEKQMDTLQSEGLIIPATRQDLVANQLVLITPASSTGVKDFQDLARPEVKVIALGEPTTVPAGMYGRQVLEHLGLLAATEKKIVFAKDVRSVRTYVETGDADAGLVYRTDAQGSSKVRVVAAAPAGSHDPILYPVALLKQSREPAAARSFLEYLSGPEARAVFAKHGFVAPEKSAEKN